MKLSPLIFLGMCLYTSLYALEDKALFQKTLKTYEKISKSFTCKSISPQNLIKKLNDKEDIILVDIREPEEQKISMLKNAISKTAFLKDKEKFKNKKIVVYCTIGYRSGKFAEKHKDLDIFNLEGGVLCWSHFRGKFFKNGKETKQVHVYSRDWNFLNSSYEAVFK